MSLSSTFTRICNPAKLYLVVSAILLVFAVFKNVSAWTFLIKAAFILLWTFLLNWLCSKGFGTLAWIIVLLPFLFLFLTLFTVMDLMGFKDGFTSTPSQYYEQLNRNFRVLREHVPVNDKNSCPHPAYEKNANICSLDIDQQLCGVGVVEQGLKRIQNQKQYDDCINKIAKSRAETRKNIDKLLEDNDNE
jgi:hypothetical protein